MHLLASPAKQWEMAQFGAEQWARAWHAAASGDDVVQPLPQDKRFADPAEAHHQLSGALSQKSGDR